MKISKIADICNAATDVKDTIKSIKDVEVTLPEYYVKHKREPYPFLKDKRVVYIGLSGIECSHEYFRQIRSPFPEGSIHFIVEKDPKSCPIGSQDNREEHKRFLESLGQKCVIIENDLTVVLGLLFDYIGDDWEKECQVMLGMDTCNIHDALKFLGALGREYRGGKVPFIAEFNLSYVRQSNSGLKASDFPVGFEDHPTYKPSQAELLSNLATGRCTGFMKEPVVWGPIFPMWSRNGVKSYRHYITVVDNKHYAVQTTNRS